MEQRTFSVVFAGEARASLLASLLPHPIVCVRSRAEFLAEINKRGRITIAFVDIDLLYQIDGEPTFVPIVAVLDDPSAELLPRTVRALRASPWLSHFVSTSMLRSPLARSHLAMLIERLAFGTGHEVLGAAGVGRVALLARASRREARFERMHEFFAKQGLSKRTIATLNEIAEELVMNALYDAPVESGYFPTPVSRTEDVELPADHACEISYGVERGDAFVRVRDPFGALTRTRLLEVLNRCVGGDSVGLDESRGGAGLGLWRVFKSASRLSITVVRGRLTDIIVWLSTKGGRAEKQMLAMNLYFASLDQGDAHQMPDDDFDLFDQSITLVQVA